MTYHAVVDIGGATNELVFSSVRLVVALFSWRSLRRWGKTSLGR
jgi:hypothetical protein